MRSGRLAPRFTRSQRRVNALLFAALVVLAAGTAATAAPVGVAAAEARPAGKMPPTVTRVLRDLHRQGQLDDAEYRERRTAYRRALDSERRLAGARRSELSAVIGTLQSIAARGRLTVSRLEPLFQTLERNRAWLARRGPPAAGRRVTFPPSQVVWRHRRGQGLQLDPRGSFRRADALWAARNRDARLRALLDEMETLAARRAGTLAWELYFRAGAATPPRVSATTQRSAIRAYRRGATRLGEPWMREAADQVLRP